jgi:hypothetical protein
MAFLKLIPTFLALEICILPIWPSIQILFAYLAFPSALVEGTVSSQGRLTRNDTISLLSLFYSVTHRHTNQDRGKSPIEGDSAPADEPPAACEAAAVTPRCLASLIALHFISININHLIHECEHHSFHA